MKRVEAFLCDDGTIESDVVRAAAYNLLARLPAGINPNAKELSFSECLSVIRNRAIIEKIFAEMDEEWIRENTIPSK